MSHKRSAMMLSIVVRSATLVLATAFTGCAATYTPPIGGPIATVNFVASPEIHNGFAFVFSDDSCGGARNIGTFGEPTGQLGTKLGEALRGKPLEPRMTAVLRADQKTNLIVQTMQGGIVQQTCAVNIAFTPAVGETYNVNFSMCRAEVTHVSKDGNESHEPSMTQPARRCQPQSAAF